MNCPRCKETNPADAIVCEHCGLKLKTICPRCKEPNKLGQPKCIKCSLTLIRYCPECKAPNFPQAKTCRKCGAVIRRKPKQQNEAQKTKPAVSKSEQPQKQVKKTEQSASKEFQQEKTVQKPEKAGEIKEPEANKTKKETAPEQKQASSEKTRPEETVKYAQDQFKKELTRNEAERFLQKYIQEAETGCLIGICAPNGIGKSTITSSLAANSSQNQIIWLSGQCDPLKKNESYSLFKDIFSSLLGIPLLVSSKDEIDKSLKENFRNNFDITDEKVLNAVNRIVLNDYKDCEEAIEKNNKTINEAILKIFLSLEKKGSVILLIEDFEYIDNASLSSLKFLLKNGFLSSRNFLIINHTNSANISRLFPEEISAKKFLLLVIKYLSYEELNNITVSMLNNQDILPEELKNRIYRQAKGLFIYLEQTLWYLFQIGAIYPEGDRLIFNQKFKDIDINPDIIGLFNHRLALLEKTYPGVEDFILTASVFGLKFPPGILIPLKGIDNEKVKEALQILVNNGILNVLNNDSMIFKHINLWEVIFEKGVNDGRVAQISSKMLSIIENNKLNISSDFVARLAEYSGKNENMTYYYSNAAQEAFYLGDSISYTENQVKVYERISNTELSEEEKEAAKLAISEQIGKVNYELNPNIAIQYLTQTIEKYETLGDKVKLIELTGYLSKSYELSGDFNGVLECAERAATLSQKPENSLEVILLNYPKTDALFNLGRLQEVIMLLQDDFLPAINRSVSKNETLPGLGIEDIKTIEYEASCLLAKSLIFQGNKQASEILDKVISKAEKEGRTEYWVKAMLGQALLSIIQGNIKNCENILTNIEEKEVSFENSSENQLEWLLILILSNMLTDNYDQARNICYSALSISKENKNYNYFALLKLLSGYFYKHFQYYKNAATIYEETANYCSETKMATGALYSWYFAAESEMQTGNPDKAAEIAERALDISQKPNINNYIINIMLLRLLAEIKIVKGDLESAQINVETALNLADENQLYFPLIMLYITLGKIYQESATNNKENGDYACSCAYRAYIKAYETAEKIENGIILEKINKVISGLTAFCKLSGINLEK